MDELADGGRIKDQIEKFSAIILGGPHNQDMRQRLAFGARIGYAFNRIERGCLMSPADTPDPQRWREAVRQEWEDADVIAAWRKWAPQARLAGHAATQAMLEAAQLSPRMQVLDLASGAGNPALELAEAVAPHGWVTVTDLIPQMLAIAQENAQVRGLTNLSFCVADPEALPFPDQTFDVVTCRFGVMYFPDVGQALQEIYRVLKSGGRVVFTAIGPFEQNPYFTTTMGVLMRYVPLPPSEPGAPHPFRFAQAGTLTSALQTAGFQQIQEGYRTIPWPVPGTVEQVWDYIRELAAPFRPLLARLSPAERVAAVSEVLAGIRRYHDGQQANFPWVIVLVTAVR